LCIVAPVDDDGDSDITSVAFHPLSSTTSSLGGGGAANSYSRDMTIYLSVGCGVYGYDLRNADAPIIRSYDTDLSSALQCEDEVNEVVFSRAGAGANNNGKIRFAAADDMGAVRLMENVPFKLSSDSNKNNTERKLQRCRVLQHAIDDDNAMATCCAFRPRGANDLVSGGTDCAIRLWDVSRPQRPSSSVQISGDESGNAQVCNPPFVNQIAFSKHGTLVAAALGDGTASILGIKGRSISQRCRLSGGHSSSVASVLFPSFGSETSSNIAANDRLLITGGSDGIMFWDIGSEVAGKNAVDPSTWLCCAPSSADNVAEDLSSLSLRNNEDVGPRVLFGIAHGEKINTITSSTSRETVLSSSLFVADTSNDVTAYMIARN
jgi:WD40 repeat protein